MMTNPWDIDEAFEPMFTDAISIDCNSGRQTLKVIVFDASDNEALSEDMVDSDRKYVDIYFMQKDWAFVKQLRRGDVIERNDKSIRYAVRSVVNDELFGVVVHARESK